MLRLQLSRSLSRSFPSSTSSRTSFPSRRTIHNLSGPPPSPTRWPTRRSAPLIALSSAGLLGVTLLHTSSIEADAPEQDAASFANKRDNDESLLSLARAYVVYATCSIPALVDNAPTILSTLQSIPVVRVVASTVVRYTFFDHFVGGETALETFPLLEHLRSENRGALLGYSVEAEGDASSSEKAQACDYHVEEVARSVDAAAQFESQQVAKGLPRGKTWVAVKLTALLPSADTFERLSTYLTSTRQSRYKEVPYPHSPSAHDLDLLSSASISPPAPLTSQDIEELNKLYQSLRKICATAKEKGVTIIMDAEYTWYQPAIDAVTLELTREFNRPTLADPSPSSPSFLTSIPLLSYFASSSTSRSTRLQAPTIYGTYQSYLRRGIPHIQLALSDARREGYMLGAKLVRGAYQPMEVEKWEKKRRVITSDTSADGKTVGKRNLDEVPPVWTVKADSDETYNQSAEILVQALDEKDGKTGAPVVGVLFGTHNPNSCERILDALLRRGLATPIPSSPSPSPRSTSSSSTSPITSRVQPKLKISDEVASRLTIAQLLGMRDDLTDKVSSRVESWVPIVMKFVPYGTLEDVIPYLARRAIENKSVLGAGSESSPTSSGENGDGDGNAAGGASYERKMVGKKIWKRLFG